MPSRKRARKPQKRFVLDCSIVMAWAFEDEADAYAESVGDAMPDVRAFVPALWPLEVANCLLVGERRKRTTEVKVLQFLAEVRTMPIVVDEQTAPRAWRETLVLARTHQLSVYDAAYLELASRRGLPLATLDRKLKAAAAAVGVPLFTP
jgi:predicted nucleic acid-binding protein